MPREIKKGSINGKPVKTLVERQKRPEEVYGTEQ